MSLVDGKLHHELAMLQEQVKRLEAKVERLQRRGGGPVCEGCLVLQKTECLTRCLRCERDLCPECLAKETCPHSKDGRHV